MLSRLLSGFGTRRARCIGVDIGASSIKVARLAVEKDQPRTVAATSRPTPRGALDNYRIADTQPVAYVLRDALREVGARGQVAVALPAPAVMVKRIQVSKSEAANIRQRVHEELSTLAPKGLDDLAFDFQVVGENAATNTIDVLIGGTRREIVDSYARVVAEARADLGVVDLDYFALQNVAECYPQPPTRGVVLMVHGGHRYTALNVVAGGQCVFATSIELGGRDATCASHGQPLSTAGEEDALRSFVAGFCDEVHHTLNFYCTLLRERPIEGAVLSGGLTHVSGLAQALSARLEMPVRLLAPIPLPAPASGAADAAEFAVALGLATRQREQ